MMSYDDVYVKVAQGPKQGPKQGSGRLHKENRSPRNNLFFHFSPQKRIQIWNKCPTNEQNIKLDQIAHDKWYLVAFKSI